MGYSPSYSKANLNNPYGEPVCRLNFSRWYSRWFSISISVWFYCLPPERCTWSNRRSFFILCRTRHSFQEYSNKGAFRNHRRGFRVLKWGVNSRVNFCNKVLEPINIWGIRKKKKEGGSEKGGWKFTHLTSPGSAPGSLCFKQLMCLFDFFKVKRLIHTIISVKYFVISNIAWSLISVHCLPKEVYCLTEEILCVPKDRDNPQIGASSDNSC